VEETDHKEGKKRIDKRRYERKGNEEMRWMGTRNERKEEKKDE
jgi:hypothetical protein